MAVFGAEPARTVQLVHLRGVNPAASVAAHLVEVGDLCDVDKVAEGVRQSMSGQRRT